MRTSMEPLEGNLIKLSVEVDADEVAAAEADTLRRLTRQARIPGFRPGKVPRRLLEARLGPKALRGEVLREALPRLFGEAVRESDLDVIAQPEIDVTAGEESGPLAFDAVVEVRPQVTVPGYEGLVVKIPSPIAAEEEIDAQVDRMREQFASLAEVSRPARNGDLLTLDVHGTRNGAPAEGLVADDLVYELGTGGIVNGADELLAGAKAGDIFELDAEDAPGGAARLRFLVKQVREKILPDADDAFASDASEFETFAELRADVAKRLGELKRAQSAMMLRAGAVEALGELVSDEMPKTLVEREARQLLEDFLAELARREMTLASYLEGTGTTEESMLASFDNQATERVRADLALRALADALEVEVDESEIDDEIVHLAGHAKTNPAAMRARFERSDGLGGLRSQLRSAKALRWLVENVSIVDDKGSPVERSLLVTDEPGSQPERAQTRPEPEEDRQ